MPPARRRRQKRRQPPPRRAPPGKRCSAVCFDDGARQGQRNDRRTRADALPSQVSEARAPQSRISRWQFPFDYAVNIGIWRRIGLRAQVRTSSPLCRFWPAVPIWNRQRGGTHTNINEYHTSTLDTMVEDVGRSCSSCSRRGRSTDGSQ